MQATKATRLAELSAIVDVPKFFILGRGKTFHKDLDVKKKYMVRSSSKEEDVKQASRAGRFPTVGPVEKNIIEKAIEEVFADKRVNELIIQEYVEAPEYGVAFCLTESSIFVEYSTVFEGVTGGIVKPFVAALPTDIARYQKLQEKLYAIFHAFGPCDVEFAGIDDPQFVQVRPITKVYEVDSELERIKMQFQEMEESKWLENNLCKVIGERKEADGAFVEGYFEAMGSVFGKFFHKELEVPDKPVIKIGTQYFMPESLHQELQVGPLKLLRLCLHYPKEIKRIKAELEEQNSVVNLFKNSILLSLWDRVLKQKSIFELRQKYRAKIDKLLEKKELAKDMESSRKLKGEIFFDPRKKTWIIAGWADTAGTVVVPGDLDNGNFYFLKNPDEKPPKDVILLTHQLYPQIGDYIQDIKGIICENGSLNSHISILAREHNIPLVIQAGIHI